MDPRHEELENKLSRKVKQGFRSSSLRTVIEIMQAGFEVSQDNFEKVMCLAARRPGVEIFCQLVQIIAITQMKLSTLGYLRVMGILLQRQAPVQQIRLWLNLCLPPKGKPVKPLPIDYDEAEKKAAEAALDSQGATVSDEEDDGTQKAQKSIFFWECQGRKELIGLYSLCSDLTCHGRPVYERKAALKVAPEADPDDANIMVHYRRDPIGDDHGWYFSRGNTGGEHLAWCPRSSKVPPRSGWVMCKGFARYPDNGYFAAPPGFGGEQMKKARTAIPPRQCIDGVDIKKLKNRVMPDDGDKGTSEYFGHFAVLMHLEFLEEVRALARRAARVGEAELARTGYAMDGLHIQSLLPRRTPRRAALPGWDDFGSQVAAMFLPVNVDVEKLFLKRGESVQISKSKSSSRNAKGKIEITGGEKLGEGVIVDFRPARGKQEGTILVKLSGFWPADAQKANWRLDKAVNKTLYQRQLQALITLMTKERSRVSTILVSSNVGLADSWAKQWRGQKQDQWGAASRKPDHEVVKLANLNPGGCEAEALDRALKETRSLTSLNGSQRDATKNAVRRTCTIIQGPPGTGKTTCSVEILRVWSQTMKLSPLLACSDSNVAVDNIAQGLAAHGVNVVRVGRPEKIRAHLTNLTLEDKLKKEKEAMEEENRGFVARFRSRSRSPGKDGRADSPFAKRKRSKSRSPDYIDDDDGKKKKKRKHTENAGGVRQSDKTLDEEDEVDARARDQLNSSKSDFELQMRILKDADVICTTCITAGGDFFAKLSFAGILMDEAAQATEMAAVVPLILRTSQRLVLVGDHCQLPPTVQSTEAEDRGLSLSVYSRLIDGGGIAPFLLDTQHRSHPVIAEFSSRAFYAGKLLTGVKPEDRIPPRGPPWPREDCPLLFINCDCEETVEMESKMNEGEAHIIMQILDHVLYQRELGVEEIGIVTPYVAQVRHLTRLAKRLLQDRAEGFDPELLEIASVDGFQGREKELIIFSAVRNNWEARVGFLADWRRLNVMLTRARRGLVVIGHRKTLLNDKYWESWFEFYDKVKDNRPRDAIDEVLEESSDENPHENPEMREKRKRVQAAQKLAAAIRGTAVVKEKNFQGEMAQDATRRLDGKKGSRGLGPEAKDRTPSPPRRYKPPPETGIGRRKDKAKAEAPPPPKAPAAKANVKKKVKLAIDSDEEG